MRRNIGAVGTTITSSLLVPLTIVAFTLVPASFLPPAQLSQSFVVGASILVLGQLTFNWTTLRNAFNKQQPA